MKRIVVVGLLARQAAELSREFPDVEFLTEKTLPNLKNRVLNADHVVMLTKFVSHKHQDLIPRRKLIRHLGGLSGLAALLRGL